MSPSSVGRPLFLSDAQLRAEIEKCEYCAEKPCKEACPADCSPADFIMAMKVGAPSDLRRAAAHIMSHNPLGGVCGAVCPEKHCYAACARRTFDTPVKIPEVQASIIERAKAAGVLPVLPAAKSNGLKVAVLGAGPSGMSAAGLLAQLGYRVDLYEEAAALGGMCALIPDHRLDKRVLKTDLAFAASLGRITTKPRSGVEDPAKLLARGRYKAVVVASGLGIPMELGIPGEEHSVQGNRYLRSPRRYRVKGKRVAIVGGGAIAADCASTASIAGASHVEMFALEKLSEMPLPSREMKAILDQGIHVSGRTRVTSILTKSGKVSGLELMKVRLPRGKRFHPSLIRDVLGTEQRRGDFGFVIIAIGNLPNHKQIRRRGVFFTIDGKNPPTTVVEATATGKNAALEVHAYLGKTKKPPIKNRLKSRVSMPGRNPIPVPLETDFFGRSIHSPFLLSAGPTSDGYEQMKKAYEAGWPGGIMKTSFDATEIHIPSEYMYRFGRSTYANCDNVSAHPLDRVCREIERLRREYPDRLTIASTGGPVTGHDEADERVWQSNTEKLESAGVMGIEYSLSCPQGGDGTKGDIVAQDPELTAEIIEWVLLTADPEVPKLFKLTAAVTAIYPIMSAAQDVLKRYPDTRAGVTLANSFPSLAFSPNPRHPWDEGAIVGMSGEGVLPISNLTLARVSRFGMVVSGNGGPMDYKAAADFLALGAKTVQFCSIVMKYGHGIIDDLHSGLSHLMEYRGIGSVEQLIGIAQPDAITDFIDLPSAKKISDVDADLCVHCGNCTRCPYLAITLNKDKLPETDPSRCISCSLCVHNCFAGALRMRKRTGKERAMLDEAWSMYSE